MTINNQLKINIVNKVIIFFLFTLSVYSQGGMKFPEFSKRLEPYFDSELIADLEKRLPQGSNYSIWGWDAGDFSGDGNYDVAFTVKIAADNRKIVQVYMFVDIDGYLTEVSQMSYEYFELPLEIGIIIKQNTCFVTKKFKQFNWEIKGYRFDNGNINLIDQFTTEKLDKFTHETYDNFDKLQRGEKYVSTNKNDIKFQVNYVSVPSYSRGRQIFRGFPSEAIVDKIDFVTKGAYYWKGSDDASFTIKSAYDSEYLYLTLRVKDDFFIPLNCDNCSADYFEAWFDVTPLKTESRFLKKSGDKLIFRDKDKGASIFCIKVYPGNFLEKFAFVKDVSSSEDLESFQKNAVKKIKAISSLKEDGYILKFRIPFAFFGYESAPVDTKTTEIGFTVVYHDIDNEFRPEEETTICSSSFDPKNPSSFGSLLLIPNDKWYGSSENIFTEDIIKNLIDMGF